jgi:SAM-dependent methyltransferase
MSSAVDGSERATLGAGKRPDIPRAELFGIVLVSGAAVMAIEILGTRIIGPVFGVNLFVWSALLAVTLGSLAIGYYAGGVLVDRRPGLRLPGFVVLVAGLLLGVVPLLSYPVLRFALAVGPRGGSLLGATLLFSPSLTLLGMIGPVAVRLALKDLRATGHGVGAVYAVSTAGSLLGTLVTGFVIVPAFDTNQILFGTATLLAITGASSLAFHGRPVALLAAFVPFFTSAAPIHALPAGLAILDRSQSLYGLVEVIDDGNRGARFLRADHSIVGIQFQFDGSSAFSFTHLLEVVRFLRPAAKDVLQIGLGTGALPSALEREGIKADVVEIDPAVVRFARQYFRFTARGEIYEEDARTFLGRTERRYDLIVHDTFTDGTTPEHLLSLEVLQRIHAILRPGGVLALNFVGYQRGPNAEASRAVARTLRAVFPVVHAYRDSAPDEDPDTAGNVLFFASDEGLDFTIPPGARFENPSCERHLRSFQGWEILEKVPDGPWITDGHNPLARLQLPAADEHFEAMNKLLPPEVWLQ